MSRAQTLLTAPPDVYSAILDESPVLVWLADASGRFTFFNRAWLAFRGKSLSEELSVDLGKAIHPEDQDAWRKRHREIPELPEASSHEFRLRSWRGHYRSVQERVIPRLDSHGRVTGYIGWVVELSDVAVHEAVLRRQQGVLRELVRHDSIAEGDWTAALRSITETSAKMLNVARCGVWMFNNERNKLECVDLFEQASGRHFSGISIHVDKYPRYFATLTTTGTIDAHEARSDPRTREFSDDYLIPLGITSMLDSPVTLGRTTVGVVCHEHVGPPRQWMVEDTTFAASISDIVAIALETHQLRQQQKALKESEERYALAVRGANDGLWDWNLKTQEVYFSPRAKSILGYEDPELENRLEEWRKRVHPEDLPHLVASMEAHLEGRSPAYSNQHRIRHKNGTYVWVHDRGVCVRDENGRPARIAGSVTDITFQKQAEAERLRLSDQRYRVLADLAPVGIVILDREGKVVFANAAAEQHTGSPRGGLLGRAHDASEWRATGIDGAARTSRENAFQRVMETKQPVRNVELAIQEQDSGDSRLLSINAAPLFDAKGEIEGVIASAVDITERIRMERALRDSNERFDLAVTGSADGIWDGRVSEDGDWANPNTRVYFSPRCKELLGYQDHEIENRLESWLSRIHPEDFTGTFSALQQHVEERRPFDVEHRLQTKSGEYRWFQARGQAVWSPEGKLVRMAGSLRDVTERRTAEEQLQKTQKELESIFEQAAVGLAYVSKEGRFLRVNQSLCNILGYSREELCEKTFVDITHEDDLALTLERQREKREGRLHRFTDEKRYLKKNGDAVWVNLAVAGDRGPGEVSEYFIAVIEDVTARKETQLRLNFLADLTARAAQGICAIDKNLCVIFWNKAAENIFGWKAEEVLGTNLVDMLVPADKRHEAQRLIDSFDTATVVGLRTERLHKDGHRIPVEVTSFPIHDPSGELWVRTLYFQDMTLVSEMESKLSEKTKMAMIGELAAAIAHEIRNPLFGISSVAQVLSREVRDRPETAELADSMLAEISRLNRLLENLLLYSRPRRLERASEDPGELWRDLLDIHRTATNEKHLSVEIDARPAGRGVNVDGAQIRQVLLNLFMNAVQASPNGGTIRVTSIVEPRQGRCFWTCSVQNEGESIPEAIRDRIFEPFFSTKEEGSGLGLSVCRKIAEDHGGTVFLRADSGSGTTFVLEVPCGETEKNVLIPAGSA